jgi:hypothetical protein
LVRCSCFLSWMEIEWVNGMKKKCKCKKRRKLTKRGNRIAIGFTQGVRRMLYSVGVVSMGS